MVVRAIVRRLAEDDEPWVWVEVKRQNKPMASQSPPPVHEAPPHWLQVAGFSFFYFLLVTFSLYVAL